MGGNPARAIGEGGSGTPRPEHAVLATIRAESEAQAEATLEAARARAAVIATGAREAADQRVARACRDAEPAIAREANRVVNEARVRAIHARTREERALLDAVFDAAARDLSALAERPGDPRWLAAVQRLGAEARRFTGVGQDPAGVPDPEAGQDPADASPLPPDADGDCEDPGELLVRSADGRLEVDATIGARLATARIRLAHEVAAVLGLGGREA